MHKSLPNGSLIHTRRGLIPIEYIIIGDEALTTCGYRPISNLIYHGIQNMVIINTTNGYFECTPNHKMAVLDNDKYRWVEAIKLNTNDKLITCDTSIHGIRTSLPEYELNNYIKIPELDNSMAWLIGIYHKVGYTHADCICFDITSIMELVHDIQTQLERFSQDSKIYTMGNKLTCYNEHIYKYFYDYMDDYKLPSWLLQATHSVKLSYIKGLLDGDTSAIQGNSTPKEFNNTLTIKYPVSARDIQTLLYSCGIDSKLYSTIKDNDKVSIINFNYIKKIISAQIYTTASVTTIECFDTTSSHTYDITVDDLHEFYVNGYLSHNMNGIRKDMMISTSEGLLKLEEVGDIYGDKYQDIKFDIPIPEAAVSRVGNPEISKMNKFYINGVVDTKKIYTMDGNELESSLNHRYRVLDINNEYIWKYTNDLRIGDRLVTLLGSHPNDVSIELNKINIKMRQPQYLTDELSLFLGIIYSNGYIDNVNNILRINIDHNPWLNVFLYTTFGFNVILNGSSDAGFNEISGNPFGTSSVGVSRNPLRELAPVGVSDNAIIYNDGYVIRHIGFFRWLKANGCLKYNADYEVPYIIRKSNKNNAIEFINGLSYNNTNNDEYLITYNLVFAKQILSLCRNVGYNVKIVKENSYWLIKYNTDDRYWNDYWLDPITELSDSRCDTYDIDAYNYLINGGTISHNTTMLIN